MAPYDDRMEIIASRVWHAWIAFPLFALAVLLVVALVVGYLVKVVAPQYPRSSQRR